MTTETKDYQCSVCGKFCMAEEYIFDHERPHLVCFECFDKLPEDELQMPDDAHIDIEQESA